MTDETPEPPGQLLSDLARLRRQARTTRHAYWFPLVLFGLLSILAAILSRPALPGRIWTLAAPGWASSLMARGGLTQSTTFVTGSQSSTIVTGFGRPSAYLTWAWTVALVAGYLLTVSWYRYHGRRTGLETPSRSYLITGAALTALATVLPPLLARVHYPGPPWLSLFLIRGTLPMFIIAAGLWVLARAERSRGLGIIAALYTATVIVDSLYTLGNLGIPLLGPFAPAFVLLAAGAATFAVQIRLRRARTA